MMRSPGLGSEIATPRLQEGSLIVTDQAFDPSQLLRGKPEIPRQPNGLEPELCGSIVAIDVNVRRLVRLVTKEVYPVRP